jgi:hypothetical protein
LLQIKRKIDQVSSADLVPAENVVTKIFLLTGNKIHVHFFEAQLEIGYITSIQATRNELATGVYGLVYKAWHG